MSKKSLLLLIGFFVFIGCQDANQPVANSAVAEVTSTPNPTATSTAMPTFTATPAPTQTLASTSTPTATVTPTNTATPRPRPTSTPIPDETPVWSEEITVVDIIPADQIAWSPKANAFLYATCPTDAGYDPVMAEGAIIQVDLENNLSRETMAQDFICSGFGVSISWAPDGERILFTALSPEEVEGLSYAPKTAGIWLREATGEVRVLLPNGNNLMRWAPHFPFWLDENTVLYSGYGGGGDANSALLDIQENTHSQLINLRVYCLDDVNHEYLFGCSGSFLTTHISVLAIPIDELQKNSFELNDKELSVNEFISTSMKNVESWIYLSRHPGDGHNHEANAFNSLFMDRLPGTNQLLVLTWEDGIDLELDPSADTQLQLWNIDDGTLTMVVPHGKDGLFSPDGRYLAYVLPAGDHYEVHLLDRRTGEILFSQPGWVNQQIGLVNGNFSFSRNGRYFTALAPDPENEEQGTMTVYDLLESQVVTSLPVRRTYPIWSPENDQFVYKNQHGDLSVFQLVTKSTVSLAENNDDAIRAARWSHDGRYLSVQISPNRTAILEIP